MKSFWTFILYIVFPIIVLAFLFWLGWGGGFGGKNNLMVKEVYGGNIGIISSQSKPLERSFTVVNGGEDNVTIAKVYTDCKCLSVSIPIDFVILGPFSVPIEENIKPLDINIGHQGEIVVKMVFDPREISTQNFSGNIFIETLKAGEILKIPIKANIVEQ